MQIKETKQTWRCVGCGHVFNSEKDVCTIVHTIGASAVGDLCPPCHITALGQPQPHPFRQAELL